MRRSEFRKLTERVTRNLFERCTFNRHTHTHTDRQTDPTTVTLAAYARRRGLINQFMYVLRDQFLQKWHEKLQRSQSTRGQGGNKLRSYRKFKSTFELEFYLDNILVPKYRAAIARLRTSGHQPAIETGRYHKPKPLAVPVWSFKMSATLYVHVQNTLTSDVKWKLQFQSYFPNISSCQARNGHKIYHYFFYYYYITRKEYSLSNC